MIPRSLPPSAWKDTIGASGLFPCAPGRACWRDCSGGARASDARAALARRSALQRRL